MIPDGVPAGIIAALVAPAKAKKTVARTADNNFFIFWILVEFECPKLGGVRPGIGLFETVEDDTSFVSLVVIVCFSINLKG